MSDRILICDDDAAVRGVLSRLLAHEGYAVRTVESGAQALQEIAHRAPDLLILDVEMPGLSGFEICRRIRLTRDGERLGIALLTGLSDSAARIMGLESGADDFLTKPFEFPVLLARVHALLRVKHLTDQLENTENVVFTLARTVEARDAYTDAHLWRLAEYSHCLCRALGGSSDAARDAWYGGVLHDIGKIGVSDTVLRKPGRLTPEERTEMERHPDIGAEIVATMRFASRVAPIVRGHHERWDGLGYPMGLQGEQIPIGARIVAVVDAWDAMVTDRPYRGALPASTALRRLQDAAGSQFDRTMVDVFVDLHERGELPKAELGRLRDRVA